MKDTKKSTKIVVWVVENNKVLLLKGGQLPSSIVENSSDHTAAAVRTLLDQVGFTLINPIEVEKQFIAGEEVKIFSGFAHKSPFVDKLQPHVWADWVDEKN